MRSGAKFAVVVTLLFGARARAETLVYSLSYTETQSSFQAHFSNVSSFPGLRSPEQNLAMLRRTRKTDIYSVSLPDGKTSLLFSDEGPHLETQAIGGLRGGEAYLLALWREWRTVPYPGAYENKGYYAVSLDGSNHFRRIGDAPPNAPPAFLNPQGTKAVAEGFINEKFIVSIYAVPDWKPLATWDLSKLLQTRCPDCSPSSFGWMADGNRLYVELAVVGDDEDHPKLNHEGTYILSGGGADLGPIPLNIIGFQFPGYVHPKFAGHRFLGQLPDGRNLFLEYAAKQEKPLSQTDPFLALSGPDSRFQKAFPLKFAINACYISPSERYLAYIERRTTSDYRSELHLWVKNLETGEDKELLATPPPNPPNSPEPNVSLSIVGWLN